MTPSVAGARVAVTGLGQIAPHGDEPDAAFTALLNGRSEIALWAHATAAPAAVGVARFDVSQWFTRLQLAGVDRVSQIAVAAALRAWADAGLAHPAEQSTSASPQHGSTTALASGAALAQSIDAATVSRVSERAVSIDPERIGIYVGCGMGGAAAIEQAFVALAGNGRVPPLTVPAFMPNAPAAHVAMRLKAEGPVLTYSVACASSAVAIAEAARAVASGDIDVAVAGGSEALLVPGVIRSWQAMQTLAVPEADHPERACRPFSIDRSGFVLGEGAAFLVLESTRHAAARGARVYASVAGSGLRCDAMHLTKPDSRGQQRALRAALSDAGLQPKDVGYCNAHGTATKIGDVVECDALRAVWGDDIGSLRVSATKSMHGHLLGAAGALEAVITVLALHRRSLPPTAHCSQPDPACDVPLILVGESAPTLRYAISSSFAFGGTNAVLAFGRADTFM